MAGKKILEALVLAGFCISTSQLYASENGYVEGEAASKLITNGNIIGKQYSGRLGMWFFVVESGEHLFHCEFNFNRNKENIISKCWH